MGHFGPGHGHFEFTVDHDLKEARIFLLMEDGERPQALPLESLILSIDDPTFTLEMKAVPGKEDRAGFSSSFVGKHYKLGIVREFSGRIEGLLEGRKISGRFKEEPPR